MKQVLIAILLIVCLFSCNTRNEFAKQISEPAPSESETEATESVSIDSVSFSQGPELSLSVNTQKSLFLTVTLSNGKSYHNIKKKFYSIYPSLNANVLWYVNDPDIAKVSANGKVMAIAPGTTTVLAWLKNRSAALTLKVWDATQSEREPEPTGENSENETDQDTDPDTQNDPLEKDVVVTDEPESLTDAFLSADDVFEDEFTADSGFGYEDFPDILYGPPVDVYDVVSFGMGGRLTIELTGFIIADGPGVDFTVFENPFSGWEECAEVSVSEDGSDYHSFPCDQYDSAEVYAGCAGVTPVNYGLADAQYLDPDLSGGDGFDLAELPGGPKYVRFIRITDIGLCRPAPSTASNPGGFDLDAIAIINGVYD